MNPFGLMPAGPRLFSYQIRPNAQYLSSAQMAEERYWGERRAALEAVGFGSNPSKMEFHRSRKRQIQDNPVS